MNCESCKTMLPVDEKYKFCPWCGNMLDLKQMVKSLIDEVELKDEELLDVIVALEKLKIQGRTVKNEGKPRRKKRKVKVYNKKLRKGHSLDYAKLALMFSKTSYKDPRKFLKAKLGYKPNKVQIEKFLKFKTVLKYK